METGFTKADSNNLPNVDSWTVANFFASNEDFLSSEMRNGKTTRSSRESYGDEAIGYVQLQRKGNLCTVKCVMCPEHKVRNKPYAVSMVINEEKRQIRSVECHHCKASEGGCKHAVALLMWCHRRSEEPACTSTECYWKKSRLSTVGSSLKCITIKKMYKNSMKFTKHPIGKDVLKCFVDEAKRRQFQDIPQIIKHQHDPVDDSFTRLSMHKLSITHNSTYDCAQYLANIKPFFTQESINTIEKATRDQHQSGAWHELRYARITASIAHNVSRCQTSNGTLVASIMGAKTPDTPAMKRGRALEDSVRQEVEKQTGKIRKSGLVISKEHPMLAASPDGILNEDTVVEIKCPTSTATYKNYIKNNNITDKFAAQVQLQMHLTNLQKCLFCIADADFEKNNRVQILTVHYNSSYANTMVRKLVTFWEHNILSFTNSALRFHPGRSRSRKPGLKLACL